MSYKFCSQKASQQHCHLVARSALFALASLASRQASFLKPLAPSLDIVQQLTSIFGVADIRAALNKINFALHNIRAHRFDFKLVLVGWLEGRGGAEVMGRFLLFAIFCMLE